MPQFLLKRFADASGKLVMVKRDNLDCSVLSTVNNACNEAGYYRIETDDLEPEYQEGHDPEAIEKSLSAFEGRAQTSITNLEAYSPPWTPEDRYNLSMFTAFQVVRGWSLRRQMNELATLTMRREMAAEISCRCCESWSWRPPRIRPEPGVLVSLPQLRMTIQGRSVHPGGAVANRLESSAEFVRPRRAAPAALRAPR